MGDQNQCEAEFFAELAKNAENFHLGDGIERGCRLVCYQDRGIARDGLGNQGALPLASAELVGIGAHDAIGALGEELREDFACSFLQVKFSRLLMRRQYLANLLANTDSRMERQRGFLKNESDAGAPDLAKLPEVGLHEILAFEQNRTTSDVTVWRKEPQDRRRKCAFARSGFAEYAEDFSRH
ncbi:MAG TPA: hypothetical protein VFI45_11255 [Candidatus Acidoferrum sp.]|nr:hypothetical protein [Candidatus Acidoferrum sp.]